MDPDRKEKIDKIISEVDNRIFEKVTPIIGPAIAIMAALATDKTTPGQRTMVDAAISAAKKIDPLLTINRHANLFDDIPILKPLGKAIDHLQSAYVPKRIVELSEEVARAIVGDRSPAKAFGGAIFHGGDPHILLHELGHARAMGKSGLMRILSSKLAVPAAALAGIMAAKSDDYADYAPSIAAAGTIPMLTEEALASGYALKDMYKSLGTKEVIRGLTKLLPAFATYAALPYGLYKGTQWAVDEIRKTKMNKTAAFFHLGFLDTLRRKSEQTKSR